MLRGPRNTYLPSKDEVRRACHQIQQTWTTSERRKRRVQRFPEWLPPTIRVAEFRPAARLRGDD